MNLPDPDGEEASTAGQHVPPHAHLEAEGAMMSGQRSGGLSGHARRVPLGRSGLQGMLSYDGKGKDFAWRAR
jgi:hypothetical protein